MFDFIRKFFQSDATGSTNWNDVCTLVVGSKGVGKTYSRVRWFAQVFLPNYPNRRLVTNFEIKIEAMAAYVEKFSGGKVSAEDVIKRITILPREITNEWKRGDGAGPWDLKEKYGIDLEGCHLDIDEIHNFCSTEHKTNHKHAWMTWMGELRHARTTCTFVTQAEEKLSPVIRREVSITWKLYDKGRMRDEFFGFLFGDAWQLSAKLNGAYIPLVQEKEVTDFGKENRLKARVIEWSRTPDIFPLYNSYSKPIHDMSAGHRVIVFCPNREVESLKELGSVLAGSEDLVEVIKDGFKDFDFVVCHPSCLDLMEQVKDFLGDKFATLENGRLTADLSAAVKKIMNDDEAPPMEWETRSWPSLLFWFIRRNGWGIGRKIFPVVFLICFVSFGGVGWIMHKAIDLSQKSIHPASSSSVELAEESKPSGGSAAVKAVVPEGLDSSASHAPPVDPEKQRLNAALLENQKSLESEKKRADAEKKRADALKLTLARQSALVAVNPEFILLQGGYSYALNEKIDTGIFEGRTITKIDTVRRLAVLDDGHVLRLGSVVSSGQGEGNTGSKGEEKPLGEKHLRTPKGRPAGQPEQSIEGHEEVQPVGSGDADVSTDSVAG